MISHIFSTTSQERQLIELGIELKGCILNAKESYPEKFEDGYLAKIYEMAKNWDKVFKDSISPRKGE